MNWKLAGMAGTAVAVIALSGASAVAGANKFSGNVSLAVGQSFEDDDFGVISPFDDSFTSITGEAKLNVAFSSNLNLQLDFVGVGSFVDSNSVFGSADRDAGFQGAAHGYWRANNFAAGLFAGAGKASTADNGSAEYYVAGAEAQYYWNNFTFGVNGGYLDSNAQGLGNTDDEFLNGAWFADAEVRWYATPKVALSADVGYISGETGDGDFDQETWHWGAKAEYWPEEKEPLSLWVAYEGRTTTFDSNTGPASFDKDTHTVKIGVTFHFGVDGSQSEQDRNGPSFNTMDYGAIVVGG